MPEDLIKIALVGHTNTGKTSLLRTLTRDTGFGEVADSPGTTRHVEGARLRLEGRAVLEWFDTPGMEDSISLLEYLERLDRPGERLDGPARIRRFLETPEAHGRYEQEARVLAKMLDCDAALYVIDARDPVLGKHRDELAILAACGRPLLPVLNFVNAPAHRADEWRGAMARLGLHAVVEFDTVAPPLDGEQQLYAKLGVLLDRHAAALTAASNRLREQVRQREQACVDALLALYNFRRSDFADDALPLQGERWGMDLFHPQALKDMGVQVSMGAAAGAMAGAAVDLFSAGLSLGTGMLIGAAAGGLWQGVEKLGKRMAGKLRGWREISVDDAVLRLLALRQRQLIEALERRGHAAREPLKLDRPDDEAWRNGPLPEALKEARSRPEWSALGERYEDSDRRKRIVGELAKTLADAPLPAA